MNFLFRKFTTNQNKPTRRKRETSAFEINSKKIHKLVNLAVNGLDIIEDNGNSND